MKKIKYMGMTIFLIILFVFPNYSYTQDEEVLLNTMDFTAGGVKKGIPELTLSKKYKITFIGVFHSADIHNKPKPTVGVGILNSKGVNICGGEAMPTSGFNIEGVLATNPNCILSAGTYKLWDEHPPSWRINSDGYYQIKILGIAQE